MPVCEVAHMEKKVLLETGWIIRTTEELDAKHLGRILAPLAACQNQVT